MIYFKLAQTQNEITKEYNYHQSLEIKGRR